MTTPSSESILISSHPPSLLARKARSPLGGSLVIFTPFCKTCTGKLLAGIEVNHKRKPHRSSGPGAGGNPSSLRRCMGEQFLRLTNHLISLPSSWLCCSWNIPKTCVFFNFTQVLCLNLSRKTIYLLSNISFRFHWGVTNVCRHCFVKLNPFETRQLVCMLSGLNCSTIASKVGIQDSIKWPEGFGVCRVSTRRSFKRFQPTRGSRSDLQLLIHPKWNEK